MNTTALGFLALLISGGTGFLWLRAAHQVQLPKNRSGFIAVLFGAGALGAIALAKGPGWIGGVPAVLAVIIGAFFCFTVAISRQRVGVDAIRVGSTIPEFAARDENGEMFHSSALAGHPVLIKFFRAHW